MAARASWTCPHAPAQHATTAVKHGAKPPTVTAARRSTGRRRQPRGTAPYQPHDAAARSTCAQDEQPPAQQNNPRKPRWQHGHGTHRFGRDGQARLECRREARDVVDVGGGAGRHGQLAQVTQPGRRRVVADALRRAGAFGSFAAGRVAASTGTSALSALCTALAAFAALRGHPWRSRPVFPTNTQSRACFCPICVRHRNPPNPTKGVSPPVVCPVGAAALCVGTAPSKKGGFPGAMSAAARRCVLHCVDVCVLWMGMRSALSVAAESARRGVQQRACDARPGCMRWRCRTAR